MSNDPHRQGQHPRPAWTPGQPDYPPPSAQYPGSSAPPGYQYPPPSEMATIQPHMQQPQHDQYRLPPPHPGYQHQPMYTAAPPPPPQPQVIYHAAAPRQRTAIACRYCRRRKIRCSGFDSSQDGRCSNCVRFNQECMFTPVSSQAQAFVPAHAAYPHLRGGQVAGRAGSRAEGVVLYGAHGQPLPPSHSAAPPPPPQAGLPPPPGMYQQPQYGGPPPPQQAMDDRGPPPLAHSPVVPDDRSPHHVRRGSGTYDYREGPTLPPVSSVSGSSYPPTSAGQTPYYPSPGQDRRQPSHPAYQYDPRPSTSPSTTGGLPFPPTLHPPNQSRDANSSGTSGRSGLSVREMLTTEGQSTRSSTDSDMLNALNRRV